MANSYKVSWDGKRVLSAVESAKVSALSSIGDIVVDRAKSKAPVDTGKLQDSIRKDMLRDDYVIISANTDYAQYVEYGTSKQAAQPYMRPAVTENSDVLVSTIRNILASALK